MLKINKLFNLNYLIIIFLIFFILFFIIYRNNIYKINKINETFGTSNSGAAFLIPNKKKWTFDRSNDWYQIRQNGYSIKLNQTGINVNNRDISILFLINVISVTNYWRNIFHFTSTNRNCCGGGDRVPAMWIRPDNTHSYHIRFSTISDNNGGIDMAGYDLAKSTPLFIGLVFNNNTFSLYINNILQQQSQYSYIFSRNNNTILYIGDPWHPQDGNIYIKNFTIYDGALNQDDINNVYDNLEKGVDGKIGSAGNPGPPGNDGSPGEMGDVGPKGQVGDAGPQGKIGPRGPIGPTGPDFIPKNYGNYLEKGFK
jgi:hypothetical protein